jgi:hypothetical protein
MASMAYRLIFIMSFLALLGLGGDRLVQRKLDGVGIISLPASVDPLGDGSAWDDDPARLYFRFAHEYPWWVSLGSSNAYKQMLCVSLFSPTATASDYERSPPRFEPLYSKLSKERTLELGTARLEISAGRYAQNALDAPAHVYLYWDPSRRLQIAWHVVDKVVAPRDAERMIQRMAASFKVLIDPREQFIEMAGRDGREEQRVEAAVRLARDALTKAGFGAAAPEKPAYVNGIYVEWMDDPEPRFQLVKPLGLIRTSGAHVPLPHRPDTNSQPRARGSIGWRRYSGDTWINDNRDNAYLPLPGIERALAARHVDRSTTLYYYATTVRIAVADAATIVALGSFFEELPAVERAWQQGTLVDGERIALPESGHRVSNTSQEASRLAPGTEAHPNEPIHDPVSARSTCEPNERYCFGIDLQTGNPQLDSLRCRLATAAVNALPDVRAGNFDAVEAAVFAVDRDIQAEVMLGAMYTAELRAAIANGERTTRQDYITALYERALHWRISAYPEPHTAYEADAFAAGRDADRAELAALLSDTRDRT